MMSLWRHTRYIRTFFGTNGLRRVLAIQGRGAESHSRVGKSSTFLTVSSNYDQSFFIFLECFSFSSSFWHSGWASRPWLHHWMWKLKMWPQPTQALNLKWPVFSKWKEKKSLWILIYVDSEGELFHKFSTYLRNFLTTST